MAVKLCYFSGTGNTLALAKSLASKLDDAELISIPKALNGEIDFADADAVGILFPVYCFGFPLIVNKFIKQLPESFAGKYVFCISNCASVGGSALPLMNNLLKEKGVSLAFGSMLFMPSNYTPFGGAEPEAKQKKKFACAEKRIEKIAELVKARGSARIEKSFFIPDWLSFLMAKMFIPSFSKIGRKKFWADGKCNGCGLCAKVCQVKNIDMEDGRPVWNRHCEQCFACLQWCPQEAIQYGKVSIDRKRYRHPGIKASELFVD